jgi:hypothetical protein
MAKKKGPKKGPEGGGGDDLPATFDPDKQYEVTLKEAVKLGGAWLTPDRRTVLSGRAAEKLRGSISAATPAP